MTNAPSVMSKARATPVRILSSGGGMVAYGIVAVLNESCRVEAVHVPSFEGVLQRAAASERIDLVLLDLEIADAGGFDRVKRAVEALPQAAIVVTSGDEEPASVVAAIRAGARAFIPLS